MAGKAFRRDGAILSETDDGYEEIVTYDVPGSALTNDKTRLLFEASIAPGIPRFGAPHPVIPGLKVVGTRVAPEGAGGATVTVTYRKPTQNEDPGSNTSGGTVEFGAGIFTEEVASDISGDLMVVNWRGPHSDISFGAGDNIITGTEVLRATVRRPEIVGTVTRTEPTIPADKILTFPGKMNSIPWSQSAAKTWLCLPIRATTDERTGKVRVRYEFAYNSETWDFKGVFDFNGVIPKSAALNNGIAFFKVYEAIDFNRLGVALL